MTSSKPMNFMEVDTSLLTPGPFPPLKGKPRENHTIPILYNNHIRDLKINTPTLLIKQSPKESAFQTWSLRVELDQYHVPDETAQHVLFANKMAEISEMGKKYATRFFPDLKVEPGTEVRVIDTFSSSSNLYPPSALMFLENGYDAKGNYSEQWIFLFWMLSWKFRQKSNDRIPTNSEEASVPHP